MKPVVAIVVAAGSGSRLGGEVPKALREAGGRPLVSRSLDALAAGGVTRAIVVIAEGLLPEFETVLTDSPIPAAVVTGGAERQDSVLAGLEAIVVDPELAAAEFVLVHDAARALVPAAVVARVIDALRSGAAGCVPVIPVVDSIRRLVASGSEIVDRSDLVAVQTPQGFVREILHRGHLHVRERGLLVTDDAAVIEALGEQVVLVDGSRDAFKITEPLDLVIAEALLQGRW
ncbi:MAG TPA: 2-C-methyl-D-erythritol 4-phosphate cytidylyltransferase [Propionicimonas sp.]|nr:2-C-methyl-D-erythritol 4-phosphate cytidylyltransferase [Propionicimonas sp.]